jgi:hypothetical protein
MIGRRKNWETHGETSESTEKNTRRAKLGTQGRRDTRKPGNTSQTGRHMKRTKKERHPEKINGESKERHPEKKTT